MELFVRVMGIFLLAIGTLHLLRFVTGWKVMISAFFVPRWFSLLAAAVAYALAFWSSSLL